MQSFCVLVCDHQKADDRRTGFISGNFKRESCPRHPHSFGTSPPREMILLRTDHMVGGNHVIGRHGNLKVNEWLTWNRPTRPDAARYLESNPHSCCHACPVQSPHLTRGGREGGRVVGKVGRGVLWGCDPDTTECDMCILSCYGNFLR